MSMMLPFSISFFRCVSRRTGSQIVTDPKEKQRQYVQHMVVYTQHAFVRNFSYFCAPSCVPRCLYMVMVSVIVKTTLPKFKNCYQIFVEATFLHIFGSISIGFLFWLCHRIKLKNKIFWFSFGTQWMCHIKIGNLDYMNDSMQWSQTRFCAEKLL